VGAGFGRQRRRVSRLQTLQPTYSCCRCLIVSRCRDQVVRHVEQSAARMLAPLLQQLNSDTSWVQLNDLARTLFAITTEDDNHSNAGIKSVHSVPQKKSQPRSHNERDRGWPPRTNQRRNRSTVEDCAENTDYPSRHRSSLQQLPAVNRTPRH